MRFNKFVKYSRPTTGTYSVHGTKKPTPRFKTQYGQLLSHLPWTNLLKVLRRKMKSSKSWKSHVCYKSLSVH